LSRNPGALTSRTPQGHVGLCRGYFTCFTLRHKQQDFRKKKEVIEHKMCVLIFSTTSA
jgi:hypothetical protein